MSVRLVLLGDPVAHSRSPAIHAAALRATGLEGSYEAVRVDETGLRAAIDRLRHGGLTGANVTMPHKEAACRLADRITGRALRTGAVNTLWASEGQVWGDTTDVDGVLAAWRVAGLPVEAPVLVLGAGGAAAAAVVALDGRSLHVTARRPERAAELLDRTRIGGSVVPWGVPVPGAVVVNATPIGMTPGERLPAAVLEEAAGLLDLAYGPAPTAAVAAARRRGLPVADGLTMLVEQAAASFERWTGRPAPREVMERAARGTA